MLPLVILGVYMLDFATFAHAVELVGIDLEWNALMRGAYEHGLGGVMAIKAICAITATLLVLRVEHRWRRLFAAGVALSVALVGVYGNITVIGP